MDFTQCRLYNVQNFKELEYILGPGIYRYKKQIHPNYHVWVECKGTKSRLTESPRFKLKKLQSLILKELATLNLPDYYISQKGKNNMNNAAIHRNNYFFIQTDIHKFFPSTSRAKIFDFWKNKLNMSMGVARLMTNITTINYSQEEISNEVNSFLYSNNLKLGHHLPTGSPTSQILAFLANIDLFDTLCQIASDFKFTMSLYVDDITFSGNDGINLNKLKKQVKHLISSRGYTIAKGKSFSARGKSVINVTGIAICSGFLSPSSNTFKRWRSLEKNNGRRTYCNMVYSQNNNKMTSINI